MKLMFDIEANGLLEEATVVHCIVAIDVDTREEYIFDNNHIQHGLEKLREADVLCGHNILTYDLPLLKKLYQFTFNGRVDDTLVGSKLRYPRRTRHSLGSWGQTFVKLGWMGKGKYEQPDFDHYIPAMLDYCIQDVKVNLKLLEVLEKGKFDFEADYVRLEHDTVLTQNKSAEYGVCFDLPNASKLIAEVIEELNEIQSEVEDILGYHFSQKEHRLKRDGTPNHHAINLIAKLERQFPEMEHKIEIDKEKGVSYITVPEKITLSTKKLLVNRLLELGWQCTWFTLKGSHQVARKGVPEPNLSKIEGLGGTDIGKYYVLKHRLSLLEGLIKVVRKDGKIPSEADTLGAITGRYTHRKIANFPSVESLLGKEIRGLFGTGSGRNQVGCDLSGIEARLLAHYMDDQEFTDDVLHGDVHTKNKEAVQELFGFDDEQFSRSKAKTFFYGVMYGSGDLKAGSLVNGGSSEGALIKQAVFNRLPKLAQLIEDKQQEASKGFITSLDGRRVYVTKSEGWNGKKKYDTHKALNTLLQSSGAIYFKRWLWFIEQMINDRGVDANLMISYHDEVQYDCHPDDVGKLKCILHEAIIKTDTYYQVKCNNACEIKVGHNWKDCH